VEKPLPSALSARIRSPKSGRIYFPYGGDAGTVPNARTAMTNAESRIGINLLRLLQCMDLILIRLFYFSCVVTSRPRNSIAPMSQT
jgi:hypothetical protein